MAKSNEAQLVMRLEAKTRDFERSLKKIEGKLHGSTGKMNKRWNKSMSSMERRASRFGSFVGKSIGTGLAVGTAALVIFTKKSLQYADDLQHFSEQVGIGAEKLQEYHFVASRLGVSQEKMNKAFKTGTANIGEFAISGAGEAASALKQMGLDQDILSGKLGNTGEILDFLIQKLGDEENAFKRAGWAAEIFGQKSGVQLSEMIGLGSDAINEMKKEARDLGVVLSNEAVKKASDANDMLGKLGDTIRGNFTKAIVELAPEIEELSQMLIDLAPQLADWAKAGVDGLKSLGATWRSFGFGEGEALEPTSMGGINEQIKKLERLKELQTYRFENPTRSKIGMDQKGVQSKQWEARDLGRDLFGEDAFKSLENSEYDFEGAIAAKFTELNSAWDVAYEKFHSEKKKKPVEAAGGSGGGSPFGASSKTGFSDKQKAEMEAFKSRMDAQKQVILDNLAQAKALYEASRTPMEEYQARLVELAAVEGDVFLADAAGGAETFARLRISALGDLADATGDYEGSLRQLNVLQAQGVINVDDAVKAKEVIAQSTQYTQQLIDKEMELLEVQAQKIEQDLILAELGGSDEKIQTLQKELAIIRETMSVIANGGNLDTAQKSATDFINAQDVANIHGQIRDATKGAFRAAIDGEFGDYLSDKLGSAADKMFDKAIDGLLDVLLNQIDLGGLFGGGKSGGIGGFLSSLFSFDGGGFTGRGSRSGGVDGKGGFAAILHPNETVVDHTKGLMRPQAAPVLKSLNGSGASTVTYAPVSNFYGHTEDDLQQNLNARDAAMKRQIDGEFNGKIQRFNKDRERGYA